MDNAEKNVREAARRLQRATGFHDNGTSCSLFGVACGGSAENAYGLVLCQETVDSMEATHPQIEPIKTGLERIIAEGNCCPGGFLATPESIFEILDHVEGLCDLCVTCKLSHDLRRRDNDLDAGIHCNPCWDRTVAGSRQKSW